VIVVEIVGLAITLVAFVGVLLNRDRAVDVLMVGFAVVVLGTMFTAPDLSLLGNLLLSAVLLCTLGLAGFFHRLRSTGAALGWDGPAPHLSRRPPTTSAHLDEDLVVALASGQATPSQLTQAEPHLAGCAACSELLAAAIDALAPVPSPGGGG
jgi:hypothetical protein